jgi:hypothetical protein
MMKSFCQIGFEVRVWRARFGSEAQSGSTVRSPTISSVVSPSMRTKPPRGNQAIT